MTSRRPYWCPKQWNGGHVGVQTSSVGVELFPYANAFFCSNKFAYMLATWVKTLYKGEEPCALTNQLPKAFHHSASEWPELSDQSEVRKWIASEAGLVSAQKNLFFLENLDAMILPVNVSPRLAFLGFSWRGAKLMKMNTYPSDVGRQKTKML